MNLEQRVQALEDEVQILKNQIQATLLGIQENLLTNAYPSLRAAEITSAPAPIEIKEPEIPAPKPAPQQNLHKVVSMRDIELQPAAESELAQIPQPVEVIDPPATSKLKKIAAPTVEPEPLPAPRMNALMSEETQPAPPPSRKRRNRDGEELSASDWAALTKLEDWTRQRVEEIGAPSTRTLIEQYARKRKLSPDVADALIQFIAAFENTTWENETPSSPDAPSTFLQHFVHEAVRAEVDPLMFLNEENDLANNGITPFVFDPMVWNNGDGSALAVQQASAPIRVVNGDGTGNERKSRKQLIGRLIEGLKKVESEV